MSASRPRSVGPLVADVRRSDPDSTADLDRLPRGARSLLPGHASTGSDRSVAVARDRQLWGNSPASEIAAGDLAVVASGWPTGRARCSRARLPPTHTRVTRRSRLELQHALVVSHVVGGDESELPAQHTVVRERLHMLAQQIQRRVALAIPVMHLVDHHAPNVVSGLLGHGDDAIEYDDPDPPLA
jgi:hypothetical protein